MMVSLDDPRWSELTMFLEDTCYPVTWLREWLNAVGLGRRNGDRSNTVRHDIRGSRTEEMAGCLGAEERLPVWHAGRDGRGRHAHKFATAQQQATRVAGQECGRGLGLSVFSKSPRLGVLVS